MGKNLVHCGDAGAGGIFQASLLRACECFNLQSHLSSLAARVKLCNNLALGISMIGTCEAMDLVCNYYTNHHQP